MSGLKEKLLTLGFKPKDGKDCVYIKKYCAYEISIDYNEITPQKSCIDYGKKYFVIVTLRAVLAKKNLL